MAETTTGPSYYQKGTIQVWDFIRDKGLNFHLGNAVKYICRYGHKGDYNDHLSDLNKANHYLDNERTHLQRSRNSEDLPGYDKSNSFISASGGISKVLSDMEFPFTPGESQAAGPYSGGVQGIFGSGRDAISFE